MFYYKIINPGRVETEIDRLQGFQEKKDLVKEELFKKIIDDAKENLDQISPEKLFEPIRLAVWFHSIYFPKLYSEKERYDTFVIYYCQLADNRRDILITLE
ncbi:hypothetical protein P7E02_14790 [Enterococcus hulanensis]|uniref:hypothetical protein n=1 Tax=Enterococcus hulanensis TaxID=2559929 RepID=UPI00288E516A|nr:hypothetical protein [Enterococcus hulanensis]MDT2661139.1 hypothetical protein [Enterococcus hulanensis]